MNTPTPTPRTDAAWASSFEPCEYRAAHTARTMRECSQQLETELVAITAERDLLRAEVERLKDGGVQRIKDTLATTLDARDAAIARAERAEAEAVLLKTKLERHCSEYNDRLSELRYAENMQRQAEADLATERARLDWFYEADIASQDIRAAIDAAMKEDAK